MRDMGIGRFFKRRRPEVTDTQVQRFFEDCDDEEPRPHHYLFAHRVLPKATFQLGLNLINILTNDEGGPDFLDFIWTDVGEELEISERLEHEDWKYFCRRMGDYEIAVVTMPAPTFAPEAYFAAIVCGPVPAELSLDHDNNTEEMRIARKTVATEYFTLEMGLDFDQRRRTVFCGWTRDGSHCNFGDGPTADAEVFYQFVTYWIRGRTQRRLEEH